MSQLSGVFGVRYNQYAETEDAGGLMFVQNVWRLWQQRVSLSYELCFSFGLGSNFTNPIDDKNYEGANLNKPDRNSKSRVPVFTILCGALLLMGALAGAAVQKYFGLGNVLRQIGIPYPTVPVSTPMLVHEIPQAYLGNMKLFVLAGQSNMVGWAPVPENENYNPRIYMFGADYQWHIARDPVFDAYNQVDKVSENRIAGFGPSLPFAIASLERHPDLVIGLIPCAKNSSGIIQWQRNLSDHSLYGSCLKRVLAASPAGEIYGLLFFQGEQDALDPGQYPQPEPQPENWAHLFSKFVFDFRSDINQPDLPVVFAQIGVDPAAPELPNWNVVKEQQRLINLPMTTIIITDDLPLMDGLHFTADSYRIIGERFAEAFWDLIDQKIEQ